MKVVIDTNILVAAISSKSKYHWIIRYLKEGKFSISISNDIISEYEEILNLKYGEQLSNAFLELLFNLKNVQFQEIYYNWNLINDDESDNKFVDCFISSASDYLVTEDRHFSKLKNNKFPLINVIGIFEFQEILESQLNKS